MLKKISVMALAGMLALPAAASAGGAASDVEAKIAELTRQLEELKAQMEDVQDNQETFSEKAESWDLASRFHFSGDFRARLDSVTADTPQYFQALNIARGIDWFIDPTSAITTPGATPNYHTVSGSQGSVMGTAGLLWGFYAAAGDPLAATHAADALSNVLYGQPGGITITVVDPVTGQLTVATGVGGLTGLAPYQKTQNLVALMKTFSPGQRLSLFNSMGYSPDAANRYDNDTMMTNRLRLNMRVKATENVEFKGRLAMYKSWGMQNNPVDYTFNDGNGGGPFMLNSMSFDGSMTRQPEDSALYVDRAFVNWNNIGGQPIWFSVGRRPTTDGPPGQLRLGLDQRMATPTAFMDYPFDGLSLGYAYQNLFGLEDFPGRIRFCYGRGFEDGPTPDGNALYGRDTDFAGLSWDVYKKGDRFFTFQSFGAFNIMNVPDNVTFANPIEFALWENANLGSATPTPGDNYYDPLDPSRNLILDRTTLGNIYHTSAVYMDKYENLNYFVAGAWSRTKAEGVDELGTSLLGSWWDEPSNKDGYSIYIGTRYDLPDYDLKLGLEYNHGTKNWISFTPGNDDLYAAKLATRGDVVEAYGIWDIPSGEAISKYGKAFIRLGYQHYWYDYTGSGFWLGEPWDIDDLKTDPLAAQFYTPVEEMDQVYLTFEAWF